MKCQWMRGRDRHGKPYRILMVYREREDGIAAVVDQSCRDEAGEGDLPCASDGRASGERGQPAEPKYGRGERVGGQGDGHEGNLRASASVG